MKQGVHRRALGRAVKAAWWIDPDQDAAAVRSAGDLADILDDLRSARIITQTHMAGLVGDEASKKAWHAGSVHGKFQAALAGLRLTPETRPEQVADDAADLLTDIRKALG